eukprot:GHVS01083477.1.p1 GENE.GHVS01083477.1~~GHVS01083477.1.p1  ORF type:complete len:584 (+),score=76.63 GHVS01083477.1:504-2255(+)
MVRRTMRVLLLVFLALWEVGTANSQGRQLQESDETLKFIKNVYENAMSMSTEALSSMLTDDAEGLVVVLYNTGAVSLYPFNFKEMMELFKQLRDQLPQDMEVHVDNIVVRGQFGHTQGSMTMLGKKLNFWEFFKITGSGANTKFQKGLSLIHADDDEGMLSLFSAEVLSTMGGAASVGTKLNEAVQSTAGDLGVLDSVVPESSILMRIDVSETAATAVHRISKTDLLRSQINNNASVITAGPIAAIVEMDQTDAGTKIWDSVKLFAVNDGGQVEVAALITNQDAPYAQRVRAMLDNLYRGRNTLSFQTIKQSVVPNLQAVTVVVSNEPNNDTIIKPIFGLSAIESLVEAWKDKPQSPQALITKVDVHEASARIYANITWLNGQVTKYWEFVQLDGSRTNPRVKRWFSLLTTRNDTGIVQSLKDTGLIADMTPPLAVETYVNRMHEAIAACDIDTIDAALEDDLLVLPINILGDGTASSTKWTKAGLLREFESICKNNEPVPHPEISFAAPFIALTTKVNNEDGNSVWAKLVVLVVNPESLPDHPKFKMAFAVFNREVISFRKGECFLAEEEADISGGAGVEAA